MPKPRVGQRLKEAVGKNRSANRSADLVGLTNQYNILKDRLKLLVAALKAHHASLVQINQTRLGVAKQIVALSNGSPIYDVAGKLPPTSEDGTVTPNHGVNSYASIHVALSGKHQAYADKYLKFVVNYAIEWERVVVTRISTSLKKAQVIRRNLDHYQGKVESIRQSVNVTMAKGKSVDAKTADKLKRNEEKLKQAKREYDDFTSDLCTLMEELTERSWKDLHPILVKMAQFDATLSNDEARSLSGLNGVVDVLKKAADKHGLKPNARLKDIETLTAKMISTKEAEGMIEGSGAHLAIKADETTEDVPVLSPTNSTSSDPWGTGTISPAPIPGHTVSAMLTVAGAAAPPPTLDQVESATAGMKVSPSGLESFSSSLPPLPPSSMDRSGSLNGSLLSEPGNRVRSFSGYDSDSTRSMTSTGPIAPAPAAPPPPPPAPTGLSMYSDFSGTPKLSNPPPAPAPTFGGLTRSDSGMSNSVASDSGMGNPWSTGPIPGSSSTNPFDPPQAAPAPPMAGSGPPPMTMRGQMDAGTNPFDD